MAVRKSAPASPSVDAAKPPPSWPALEIITRHLCKRHAALADRPFEVPAELYRNGAAEMTALMKARGFPLPTSAECPYVNFLLFGKVIVQGE